MNINEIISTLEELAVRVSVAEKKIAALQNAAATTQEAGKNE